MTVGVAFDGIEISNERLFPYAPETLFEAFADPDQLVHWWGPAGFTNTLTAFDLRPGGAFNLTMHNSRGQPFDLMKTFHVVERPNRVVLEHHGPSHRFMMTMRFEPEGSGTRLTWRMQFATNDETTEVAPFIRAANEQNFDRLLAFLEERQS